MSKNKKTSPIDLKNIPLVETPVAIPVKVKTKEKK